MSMLDLATINNPEAAIERSDNPTEFVVAVCERAKTWLQLAKDHDNTVEALEKAKETKQFAATLRTATIQKELGKDCELAAQEVSRRAERLMAELIKLGQQNGEVKRKGEGGGWAAPQKSSSIPGDEEDFKPRALDFFGHNRERTFANVMADAPEDQFEEVLAEAKEEGNLSRENVVRKLKGERVEPRNEWHRKTRKINSTRVVREAVFAADTAVTGLDLLNWDEVTLEDWWVESLTNSIAALRQLLKHMKGMQA